MTTENSNDPLTDIFDVEIVEDKEHVTGEKTELTTTDSKIEDDAEYARRNIYDVVENSAKAVDMMMDILREGQHPRAAEVLANLLKTQADAAHQLLKLQKDKKELTSETDGSSKVSIDKAIIFNGSTTELLKMIKNESNKS